MLLIKTASGSQIFQLLISLQSSARGRDGAVVRAAPPAPAAAVPGGHGLDSVGRLRRRRRGGGHRGQLLRGRSRHGPRRRRRCHGRDLIQKQVRSSVALFD